MQILDALDNQRAIGLLDDNHEFKNKTVMGLPFLGGIKLE